MRLRGSLFWGIVLIILAFFLLANQLDLLHGDVFGYFWPVVVILFGLWLLIGAIPSLRQRSESQSLTIPLENAHTARIKLDHGAGRLNIHSGAASTELLAGKFGAEVEHTSRLEADHLEVKLRNSSHFWAWYPGQDLDWDIALNGEASLALKIDSGASATILNLNDLKVTDLNIDTGASSTEIVLPANAGNTHVDIDTGASSLKINLPAGVAARIRVKTGVTSVNIDPSRFPRVDGGLYQSADYMTAANRADITIDSGVGSITIG